MQLRWQCDGLPFGGLHNPLPHPYQCLHAKCQHTTCEPTRSCLRSSRIGKQLALPLLSSIIGKTHMVPRNCVVAFLFSASCRQRHRLKRPEHGQVVATAASDCNWQYPTS